MSINSERIQQSSSSQRLLLVLEEASAKLEELERSKTEPIAIVGMSCRFPGADSPETFWQLLEHGKDVITEVPTSRWDRNRYYDPNPEIPGKICTLFGGFIEAVDQFEPQFFAISSREALYMDPQQRLLLEVAYSALERGSLAPDSLFQSSTGVFIGICSSDYSQFIQTEEEIEAYLATGNAFSVAAGRLSYTLGLTGPAMVVDTACSSSLVAVHLAVQSLRQRECNVALAGGVNLMLSPRSSIMLSKARMLSPDGRCKTFDASANGFVRSEGCGVVVLKRLSDALANGDNILALIRGTGVNQDGASSGLTVPNGAAQEAVIRQALSNGQVEPSEVSYVEAHGTGTSLGDPIEVEALSNVFNKTHSLDNPLLIGSVKTNMGHTEAAAGIAGLIKVVLSLQHQQIPPHLHLKRLNPYINWERLPVRVPTDLTPWSVQGKRRLAGVSSFGFSGTNAHVLLEEAPPMEPLAREFERTLQLLTLSAKTETALQQLVQRYQEHLAAYPELCLSDVCFSVNIGREHFRHRLAVVAASTEELVEKLVAYRQQLEVVGVVCGEQIGTTPKVAFLFTGQGSQYVGMGRQLYNTQPAFRKAIERCDEILRPYLEKPLHLILYPDILTADAQQSPQINRDDVNLHLQQGAVENSQLLDETAYTQPALFALEYALCQLWQSWGIEPDVVMGHSVGEYVAATVAGVLSLEDALVLIAQRGRLMQTLPPKGAMVAVMASADLIADLVAPYGSLVAIAAINGPQSVVISGEQQTIETVCQLLTALNVKTKALQVSHAFHSPLMEPMLAEFRRVAEGIAYSRPKVKIISNLTGVEVSEEIASPEYWCRHILSPVQFAASMKTLEQLGYEVFLEVGSKPILLGMGRQCMSESGQLWLPSLRPEQSDWQQLLESLAQLYVRGVAVDWKAFDAEYPRRRVVLPTYPFQRQRYWVEHIAYAGYPHPRLRVIGGAKTQLWHPLLGQQLQFAGAKEIRFESYISQTSPAYLQDHRIHSMAIVPASAYLEMALAAASSVLKSENLVLEDVDIERALMLPENEETMLQVVLTPQESGGYWFQIFSYTAKEDHDEPIWTLHASGKVGKDDSELHSEVVNLTAKAAQYPEEISVSEHYQRYQTIGIEYGSSFQAIAQIRRCQTEALGQIELPLALQSQASEYQLHPVLLDGCFQVIGGIFADAEQLDSYLPASIKRLRVRLGSTTEVWSVVKVLPTQELEPQLLKADLSLLNSTGEVIALVEGLTLRRMNAQTLQRVLLREDLNSWLYQVTWKQKPLAASSAPSSEQSNWLIFADSTGIGKQLTEQLIAKGDRCVLVFVGSQYQQITPQHYQIDPAIPADYQRLLQDIDGNGQQVHGVVHLWSQQESDLQPVPSISCGSTIYLIQALYATGVAKWQHLWLITKGAQAIRVGAQGIAPPQVQQAPLWGLGKVIVLEHPEINCKCLDLDPFAEDTVSNLVAHLSAPDRENQIAYRQGSRYVARLERYQPQAVTQQPLVVGTQPFQLKISDYGILDNLTLIPLTRRPPKAGEVEIQVLATGLNFRDVLNALGMLKEYSQQLGVISADDLPFGGECAGKIVAVGVGVTNLKVGDEVIAAYAIGSFSSFVIVKADQVVCKPAGMSMEAAATIPVAFTTAHHALRCLANIKPGERVLIHAAAGGVGLAAVQIAIQAGAIVFATASPSKWDFLKSMGVEHVMNSRNLDFAQQIMTITQGQGVSIVLNSLNGEFIPKSLEVLAPRGRFVEIGKIGIWEQQQMQATRPDVSYFPFDLLEIAINHPTAIATMLRELMAEFNSNKLLPLPHKVFPTEEVADAFRYMAQAQHIGKVVVSVPEIAASSLSPNVATFHETSLVREDASYLITGGLGALGLLVAQWLVELGARHLILTSRRADTEKALKSIEGLEQMGAKVLVAAADISQPEDVTDLLSQIHATMPPLRGIIHAAGVLDDGTLLQQNWERLREVMAPKVAGAWQLHTLTQEIPLDFFVCFSSIAALVGSPGQGNYAAANAFMDALAYHRTALGLPGLSINWGAWAEAGMATNVSSRDQKRWRDQGISPIPSKQGLLLLGQLLEQNAAQVGVLPVDWSNFIGQIPKDVDVPFLEAFKPSQEQLEQKQSEFLKQLETTPVNKRRELLMMHIRTEIVKVLGLSSASQIGVNQGFTELGMDSLMAVELRNRLQTSLRCSISSTLAFDYPTVNALVNYLAQEVLSLEPTAESPILAQAALNKAELSAKLDELSQSEIEDLLAQQLRIIGSPE